MSARPAAAPSASPRPLLAIEDLRVAFGGIHALDGVSFDLARGETLGLIGPNGAGKTTVFNCITRVYEPNTVAIRLDGVDLLAQHGRRLPGGAGACAAGRARTRARRSRGGAHLPEPGALQHALGAGQRAAGAVRHGELPAGGGGSLARAAAVLLDRLALSALAERPAGSLSFPERKRVELARALAARPSLLLMDEPASGLAHEEVEALGALIRELRAQFGLTVLLVEHHMGLVAAVCDRVVVLDFGRVRAPARWRRAASATWCSPAT